MPNREAKVRVGVSGSARVKRLLRGITDETKKAETTQRKESRRTLSEAERSDRDKVRSARKAARAIAREWERAERKKRREMEVSQRRQEAASRRFLARGVGSFGSVIGGASVVGAAGSVVSGVTRFGEEARGALDIKRAIDTIADSKQTVESFARAMGQAEKDTGEAFGKEEIRDSLKGLVQTAKQERVLPEDMIGGAVVAQSIFSDPGLFLDNQAFFAQLNRATGARVADLVGIAGTIKQTQSEAGSPLSNDDLKDVVRSLVQQTGEGAVEFENLAGEFAPAFAQFASTFTRVRGKEQAVFAGALAQTMARSLKGAPESATLMLRLLSSLRSGKVQKALKDEAKVSVADDKGFLKHPVEVFRILANSRELQNPLVRDTVFPDLRGEEGLSTFLADMRADPGRFERLANVDPAKGQEMVDHLVDILDDSAFSKITDMQIEAQSVTLVSDQITNAAVDAARRNLEAEKALGVAGQVTGFNGEITAGVVGIVQSALSGESGILRQVFGEAFGGTRNREGIVEETPVALKVFETAVHSVAEVVSMIAPIPLDALQTVAGAPVGRSDAATSGANGSAKVDIADRAIEKMGETWGQHMERILRLNNGR